MDSHIQISLRQILATNIRKRRKALGLSQEQLAEAANLTQVYISNIETKSKSASIDSIERIAGALDVMPFELLSKEMLEKP